jgi:hypothetical protein
VLQGAVFVSGIAVAFDALLHEPPALARPAGAVESADFAAAAAVDRYEVHPIVSGSLKIKPSLRFKPSSVQSEICTS